VARAVKIASAAGHEARANGFAAAATLGPLVHNTDVVEALRKEGVIAVNSLDEAPGKVLIVPSHGLPPELIERARDRGFSIVDATCPHVLKAQREVEEFHRRGHLVVLVGDKSHPEVTAVAARADGDIVVVPGPAALEGVDLERPIAVVAQTTQKRSTVDAVVQALESRGAQVTVADTVCPATHQRQAAAMRLAREVDLMVVIGGRNSANTMRLAEVCRDAGVKVAQVESSRELSAAMLEGAARVGVTAGASTPTWVIEEVMDAMKEFIDGNPEKPREQKRDQDQSRAEAEAEAVSRPGEEPEAKEETSPTPDVAAETEHPAEAKPAEQQPVSAAPARPEAPEVSILKARVIEIHDDRVVVEIEPGVTAEILKDQLSSKPVAHPNEVVSVDQEIDIVLERQRPGSDVQYASKRRADNLLTWRRLEQARDSGETISGTVTEAVKGGLVVDIGVRGFVPASQVGRRFVEDLSAYVGQTLRMKVKEVERARGNVVLSHRAVLEEEERQARTLAFQTLSRGQVVDGTVTRLASFGAFVDIGQGVEGLLHISDIAWSRLKHPSEVLSEGQPIRVQILNVDVERERISLGYKQLQPDPWESIGQRFPVGSIVRGTVTKLVEFGAFVRLDCGIEGLVHISQLSDRRVAKPDEVVSVGQEVAVKVIGLREQEHRISLSIKQAQEDGERTEYRKYIRESNKADDVVTIGDRISFDPSKLKGPATEGEES
jgi:4-hydroxy-3-methylbut-2-enyl diphosphate reductase